MLNTQLKILADENIPLVKDLFSALGPVLTKPGREISAQDLTNVDCLLVRSVTDVDKQLLEGSIISTVGSATSGSDHIDKEYLREKEIGFFDAKGSNANSVAEYVLCGIFEVLDKNRSETLSGKTVGIIGFGNIGQMLVKKLRLFDVKILICDPFVNINNFNGLGDKSNVVRQVELEAILAESDVISIHVPLTSDSPYQTLHMVDATFLNSMKEDAILINASRGSVCDNKALHNFLSKKGAIRTIFDVWEDEPNPNWDLISLVDVATPHIAGYSYDGKVNGTQSLFNQICKFNNLEASAGDFALQKNNALVLEKKQLQVESQAGFEQVVRFVYGHLYALKQDHKNLQSLLELDRDQRPQAFDSLRKNYPIRREANSLSLLWSGDDLIRDGLKALGFVIGK